MLKFVALLLKCSVKSGKTFSLFYLNKGYEGKNYQPYVVTTLPGSGRDSNTGDCGASLGNVIVVLVVVVDVVVGYRCCCCCC